MENHFLSNSFTHFTLLFFIFLHITRYSFDPRIANANRGGSNLFIYLFIFFLLTSFNYTGNKTEMKKYNITGQKDTQKKKRKKENGRCSL